MKPSFTELRERLLMQKKATQGDGFGGIEEVWEDHKPLWAKVDFASSKDITNRSLRDLVGGAASLRKSIYRVTLRHDKDLPEHLRFKRGDKILQAISHLIQDNDGSDYATLFAVELYSHSPLR